MKQGLLLETQIEQYFKLNGIRCHHSSENEDKFKAIDLWIDGLPIQVTIGDWTTPLGLSRIKSKWDWTQFQSQSTAILVVFKPQGNKIAMFKNMAKGLVIMKKAGLKTGILLVTDKACKIVCQGK